MVRAGVCSSLLDGGSMRNVAVLILAVSLLAPASQARAQETSVPPDVAPVSEPLPASSPAEGVPLVVEPVRPAPAVTVAVPEVTRPAPPVVSPPPPRSLFDLPLGIVIEGLLLLVGAVIAGLVGLFTLLAVRRHDEARRRRTIAVTLAVELEARCEAFGFVPAPPNAEAGVSFVASVLALAEFDAGWRAAQSGLDLLPPPLASALARHYGAVHHLAGFVKGQSVASALRMLQANRIGGHPCPDAGAMRDVHYQLTAIFAGVAALQVELNALR